MTHRRRSSCRLQPEYYTIEAGDLYVGGNDLPLEVEESDDGALRLTLLPLNLWQDSLRYIWPTESGWEGWPTGKVAPYTPYTYGATGTPQSISLAARPRGDVQHDGNLPPR